MARAVGSNVRRKDGDAKVTGAATYIDDLAFPGMIYGAALLKEISPIDDLRSSGEYRARVAANLLENFWVSTR